MVIHACGLFLRGCSSDLLSIHPVDHGVPLRVRLRCSSPIALLIRLLADVDLAKLVPVLRATHYPQVSRAASVVVVVVGWVSRACEAQPIIWIVGCADSVGLNQGTISMAPDSQLYGPDSLPGKADSGRSTSGLVFNGLRPADCPAVHR